jgi:hypothetical protein
MKGGSHWALCHMEITNRFTGAAVREASSALIPSAVTLLQCFRLRLVSKVSAAGAATPKSVTSLQPSQVEDDESI